MSNYNTGNPVPSTDPRDLDDNATVFDNLLQSTSASVPDRLGVLRKTWHQMELDASALVSPNVAALAGLAGAADRGFYFTGSGAMSLFTLSALGRTLGGIVNAAAGRFVIGAAASGANSDISSLSGLATALSIAQGGTGNTTGLATTATALATPRSISASGDATWSVNFDGTANASAALTLAASGVGAGTYGGVTVNAKGLVTGASEITPIANGGTGNATGLAATATALATTRSIATTGDATWSVNFNGSANATAAITLAASGVGAGTYGSVTVNTKGLVTGATTATPIANGGTGATTALGAGTALGTSVVGTNTDQLASSSMIQNEIANKRTWTSYTPTITSVSGTYTTVSASGSYMVAFGICYFQVTINITTKGTGVTPVFTLPFAAKSGSLGMPFPAREGAVTGKAGFAFPVTGLLTAQVTAYDNTDLVTANGSVVTIQSSYPIA